ncbi:hypothetical protein Tco_0101478 [Tanacetum coccineum]
MDPNSSLGKICLGDDVIVISRDKVKGSRDWNSPKYQDTAVSKGKKVMNALGFYRMETDEISKRYIAPCFVNGLEAFDGVCHQTFRAARFDVLRTAESDSDDEDEYVIKRNKFRAPIYGPRPAPYLKCTNPKDRS